MSQRVQWGGDTSWKRREKGEGQWSWDGANLSCPVLQIRLLWLALPNHRLDQFLISLQGEKPSYYSWRPPQPEAAPCPTGDTALTLRDLRPFQHPHLQQVRQLNLQDPGLLLELVDGLLILLDVPLGALIKGLPVTLWGHTRYTRQVCQRGSGASQRKAVFVYRWLNIATILQWEHLSYTRCWTKNLPAVKYHMSTGIYPYHTPLQMRRMRLRFIRLFRITRCLIPEPVLSTTVQDYLLIIIVTIMVHIRIFQPWHTWYLRRTIICFELSHELSDVEQSPWPLATGWPLPPTMWPPKMCPGVAKCPLRSKIALFHWETSVYPL